MRLASAALHNGHGRQRRSTDGHRAWAFPMVVKCEDCRHWAPEGVQQHGECTKGLGPVYGGLWGTDERQCSEYEAHL